MPNEEMCFLGMAPNVCWLNQKGVGEVEKWPGTKNGVKGVVKGGCWVEIGWLAQKRGWPNCN